MNSKDEILGRIRKALGREELTGSPRKPARTLNPPPKLEGVMSPIDPAKLVEKFEHELELVSGVSHRASSTAELEEILRALLKEAQSSAVVISKNSLLSELDLAAKLRGWGQSVAIWPDATASGTPDASFRQRSFEAAIGITGIDFALAETGSLVLSSLREGSMLASLAPPVHVALYRRSQVAASLDDVLEKMQANFSPDRPATGRSMVFVTGPSRTADIEQILIRGVHGPRQVHAILVEDSCFAR